ncbi:MAG: Rrf2 family transcriptional regulator [Gemmataceae bacterium]|nr:Rrf2 family transcriptional regulator [Gemmataceae bacterium]
MKISAKAEYTCLAMAELAVQHQRSHPTSLKSIAEKYGLSHPFLMQIFLQLKGGRFVRSIRGASGGYQLAENPENIRLSDIVELIDGPPRQTSALADLPQLGLSQSLQKIWNDVTIAEHDALSEITLADVLRRVPNNGEVDFQI